MWQGPFGNGIVQTADDFGTQGTTPTHPELLDYLAVAFVRSGWDIKHMHKLMVMSATYRQNSNISRENLEKDPRNFLLERGPRLRIDRKSTRLNSSHQIISYAVFCLKKKNNRKYTTRTIHNLASYTADEVETSEGDWRVVGVTTTKV